MAEAANHNPQETRIDLVPEGQELILDPDGIDVEMTDFGTKIIIRGHTIDGEPRAIIIDTYDDPRFSTGFLSKLTRSPLGRIAAGITLAAGAVVGAGAALSACAPSTNGSNQPTYGTHQSALTMDQILNVGLGQQISWSQPGDLSSNYAEMNGEKYIFAGRNNLVVYVKCQAIEDCLTANANQVKTVQGLDAAGMAGPYSGPGIFQNQAGNNQFIVGPSTSWPQKCDIAPNANGILEVSQCVEIDPPMGGSPSVYPKNGVDHVQWNSGITKERNMATDATQNLPVDGQWGGSCGVGFEAGNIVVASQKQVIQGVTHCRIVTGTSWADLANNLVALDSLNNGPNGSTKLKHPRIMAGNVMVYARYNAQNQSYLWYALIPDLPQNPEQDGGDTGAPDAAPPEAAIIDEPDTEPAPNDVAEGVANDADAAVDQDTGPELPPPPVDAGPELPPPPIDAGQELPPEQDTGPDLPPPPVDSGPELPPPADTGPDIPPAKDATPDLPPDTSIPECATTLPEFTLKTPDCTLKVCPKDLNQLKGHTVEVNGSNTICSADIIINGKPVTLTMSNDKSGKIQVTCELFPEQNLVCEPGLNTVAKIDEKEAGAKLKTHGITVGSEASSFQIVPRGKNNSGQEIFEAASFNLPGEPKVFAVSDDGKFAKIEIPSNGKTFVINTETGEISEKQTTSTPDTGSGDSGSPDTGPTTTDNTQNKVDAGVPDQGKDISAPTSSNNPDNGGCQTGPNSQSSNHETTALILAAMALLAMYRRRQEESQPALQPAPGTASIISRTWNRVTRSLGLRR